MLVVHWVIMRVHHFESTHHGIHIHSNVDVEVVWIRPLGMIIRDVNILNHRVVGMGIELPILRHLLARRIHSLRLVIRNKWGTVQIWVPIPVWLIE